MVDSWMNRPIENRALYNPAFIAVLVSVAASEYRRRAESSMPWPIAFLVPAAVLQSDLRAELPASINRQLVTWAAEKPFVRAALPTRVAVLAPLVRDGIRFGATNRVIRIDGASIQGLVSLEQTSRRIQGEAHEIIRRAAFVGRWLANYDTHQAFAVLGIRPI
jgi:hypothetical protein